MQVLRHSIALTFLFLGLALSVAPSHAQFFNAVYSRDALDVVAVADSGSLYRSVSGGVAWSRTQLGDKPLRDAAAWGWNIVAVGDSGQVWRSADLGGTWAVGAVNGTPNLRRMAWLGGKTPMAVGSGGTVVQPTEGGERGGGVVVAAERGRGEQLELPAARAAGADLGPVLRGAERVGGEQSVAGCDADDRRRGVVGHAGGSADQPFVGEHAQRERGRAGEHDRAQPVQQARPLRGDGEICLHQPRRRSELGLPVHDTGFSGEPLADLQNQRLRRLGEGQQLLGGGGGDSGPHRVDRRPRRQLARNRET